jgi:hypothetical protein
MSRPNILPPENFYGVAPLEGERRHSIRFDVALHRISFVTIAPQVM